FEILFKQTNLYQYANLKEEFDFEIYNDYYNFFDGFMNQLKNENDANIWLQKSGSLTLPDLYKSFQHAKFIIIQRENIVENVVSNLLLKTDKIKTRFLFRDILLYCAHKKIENKYKSCDNVKVIKFEDLKKNTEGVIKSICEDLDLEFDERM